MVYILLQSQIGEVTISKQHGREEVDVLYKSGKRLSQRGLSFQDFLLWT